MWDWLRQDFRYAVRSTRHDPGFSLVAVASLALGIGANTAIFSVFDAVALDALPYDDPGELALVWEVRPDGEQMTVAPSSYAAWRESTRAFEDLAAFNIHFGVLRGRGEATNLVGSVVAPHFFDLMHVEPALGSGFRPEHGTPGNDRVALLSNALWRARFDADSAVVGQTVRYDDATYTVLGVMPAEYRHPERDYPHTQIWVPLALDAADYQESGRYLRVLGRLRDGSTVRDAQTEVATVQSRLAGEHPASHSGWGVDIVPLDEQVYGRARSWMALALAAAGFVLLIVCVNVANLMLVRSQRRSREFAIRAAVGGGRRRLAWQVLVESLLVAAVGGLVGLLLVALSLDALRTVQAEYVSWMADLRLDTTILAFMVGVSALTALGVGLVPALRSGRPDLRELMLSGAGASGRNRRAREAMIVVEVTLTVVLLFTGSLLGRSFLRLTGTDLGFTHSDILTMELSLPDDRYDPDRVAPAYQEILDRVRAVPGVTAASVVSDLPFTRWNSYSPVSVDGPPTGQEQLPMVERKTVDSAYFRVMDIPRIRGGVPAPAERAGGREAVVVNRAMARRFWPDADPVGQSFHLGDTERFVVGVVGDILDDGFDARAEERVYQSVAAHPSRGMVLTVAAAGAPMALAAAVRQVVAGYDMDIAVDRVRPLSGVVNATVSGRRLVLLAVLGFGVLALVLAAVGVFGVVSHNVNERTSEMAIRSALGADRAAVTAMVLQHALMLTGIGLAVGSVLGFVAARFIRGMLFGVGEADPVSLAVVAVVLGATAVLAAWLPARRAATVEPMEALRIDG